METNKKNRICLKGFTFIELLIGLGIFSLVVMVSAPGFKSFYCRMEISNGLRIVTCALNSARYDSIMMNVSVKVTLEGDRIVLKQKTSSGWEELKDFKLEKNVWFSFNASPIFYPSGSIVPLCSIFVWNERYSYKITISSAGQIKITELGLKA
jgi:prepilin-type N-terminal cleavage/methylation domain-containing protein